MENGFPIQLVVSRRIRGCLGGEIVADKGVPSESVSAVFWTIFLVVFKLEIVIFGD